MANINYKHIACALALLVTLTLLPMQHAFSAFESNKLKTHSIPARIFLQHLKSLRIEPVIRQQRGNKSWTKVTLFSATSACAVSVDGVLTAQHKAKDGDTLACELSLFKPSFKLKQGWTVQRIHWTGDIKQARFEHNPTGSPRPYIKVRLNMPVASERARGKAASHQLAMQLVSLKGPADETWQQAF